MIIAAHGLRFDVPDWFTSVAPAPESSGLLPPDMTVRVLEEGGPFDTTPPPEAHFDVDEAMAARLDGSTLTTWALQELGPLTIEHFVLDHMIPSALGASGHTVIHGAGVELHGRGLVLAGSSGAGKSTLALWLASLSWRWLGDDAVRLSPTTPAPEPLTRTRQPLTMWPSYPGARIHAEGHRALFANHESSGLVAEYVAKERLVVPAESIAHEAVSLVALVAVDPSPLDGPPRLVEMSMAEVANTIAQQSFLPRVKDRMAAIERLDAALALAPLVPGVRLVHPRTAESLPETAAALERLLDTLAP